MARRLPEIMDRFIDEKRRIVSNGSSKPTTLDLREALSALPVNLQERFKQAISLKPFSAQGSMFMRTNEEI